jgi:hypothetical protein
MSTKLPAMSALEIDGKVLDEMVRDYVQKKLGVNISASNKLTVRFSLRESEMDDARGNMADASITSPYFVATWPTKG